MAGALRDVLYRDRERSIARYRRGGFAKNKKGAIQGGPIGVAVARALRMFPLP